MTDKLHGFLDYIERVEDDCEWRCKNETLLVFHDDFIALKHPQLLGDLTHPLTRRRKHGREESGQEEFDEQKVLYEYEPGGQAQVVALVAHPVGLKSSVRIA